MKMDTKHARTTSKLKEALETARSYLIAGGTFSEACEEAAREAPDLNPKLIERHLFIELSATNEQEVISKINENLNKIAEFSQTSDGILILQSKKIAKTQLKIYKFSDEYQNNREKIFSLNGRDYIFVGVIRNNVLFIDIKTGKNKWFAKYVLDYLKLQLSK